MSLQSRLSSLITAIGTDIKELKARTPTILTRVTTVVDTEQPGFAVEWRTTGPGGALIAKLVGVNPIEGGFVANRSELRARVQSRDGTTMHERLILDSDGNSDFRPLGLVTSLPPILDLATGKSLADGTEVYFRPDPTNATGNGGVVWHLKYRYADVKWYFVGGPPLHADVLTEENSSSTTYAALTTAGPTIAVPLAGDYTVEQGASMYGGINAYIYMSYAIGGTAATDADAVEVRGTGTGNVPQMAAIRRKRKTLGAVSLASRYRTSTGSAGWKNRWLSITPISIPAS